MSARNLVFLPDGRLRAPLRVVVFIVIAVALYLAATTLGNWVIIAAGAFELRLVMNAWVGVVALLAAHAVMLRVFERGAAWSLVGLGRENVSPRTMGQGVVMGAVAIGIPCLLLLAARELIVAHAPAGSWWAAAARMTAFLLPAAFVEELFLRGYLFATLREAVGWKWTLIGTSVTFGLLHLENPGAGAESTLVVILAGFFLGLVVLVTRSLYAAWMAHFAWNWTLAVALHTAVSGIGMSVPNYQIVDNGPDWLTGGLWGPEGGFAAGVSLFLFTMIFFSRQLRQGHTPLQRSLHDSRTLDART